LILAKNENGDLPSQLTVRLRGRSIDIGADADGAPHPFTALSTRWRKVSEAAGRTLTELSLAQAAGPDGEFEPAALTHALAELIYAATEAFDFYGADLPSRLMGGRAKTEVRLIRAYQASVKRLRDPVSLMCNRMKHGYREIRGGRIVSQRTGAMTLVYRLNTSHGGVQRADVDVHGKVGFASVERTLHEILHGLLRADQNAADLVDGLSDNGVDEISLSGIGNLGLTAVLSGLTRTTPTVASSEPARFDGIVAHDRAVVLTRVTAAKVPEPTRRNISMRVDEVARSIDLI
jgi:hypothetical protein